jgi:predicted amidophosphoribosyltransferase
MDRRSCCCESRHVHADVDAWEACTCACDTDEDFKRILSPDGAGRAEKLQSMETAPTAPAGPARHLMLMGAEQRDPEAAKQQAERQLQADAAAAATITLEEKRIITAGVITEAVLGKCPSCSRAMLVKHGGCVVCTARANEVRKKRGQCSLHPNGIEVDPAGSAPSENLDDPCPVCDRNIRKVDGCCQSCVKHNHVSAAVTPIFEAGKKHARFCGACTRQITTDNGGRCRVCMERIASSRRKAGLPPREVDALPVPLSVPSMAETAEQHVIPQPLRSGSVDLGPSTDVQFAAAAMLVEEGRRDTGFDGIGPSPAVHHPILHQFSSYHASPTGACNAPFNQV